MQNRRCSPRWHVECDVLCASGSGWLLTRACELSEAGIRFLAPSDYVVHAELELRYRLHANQEWVPVKIKVRHTSGNGVGGQFLNLPVRERLKLWSEVPSGA